MCACGALASLDRGWTSRGSAACPSLATSVMLLFYLASRFSALHVSDLKIIGPSGGQKRMHFHPKQARQFASL